MQRIDTEDGRFAAGDPQSGTPGTMVTSLYMNDLQDEVCNAIEGAGLVLDGVKKNQLLLAMQAIVATKSLLVVPTVPAQQLASALVFVSSMLAFHSWVSTPYYTGYRSLQCGRFCWGTTQAPRPGEIEAEGDVISGAAYPSLVGYFQEQGLLVPIGDWTPKTWMLGDMGSGQYRLPDMQDQYIRATGTDVDTSTSRSLGGKQADALQKITGAATYLSTGSSGPMNPKTDGAFRIEDSTSSLAFVMAATGGGGSSSNYATGRFDSSRVARASTETRSTNTALHPRIFL